jgi:Domain of unknown function (DUF3885)
MPLDIKKFKRPLYFNLSNTLRFDLNPKKLESYSEMYKSAMSISKNLLHNLFRNEKVKLLVRLYITEDEYQLKSELNVINIFPELTYDKIFWVKNIDTDGIIDNYTVEAISNSISLQSNIIKESLHNCIGSEIGISDFIGDIYIYDESIKYCLNVYDDRGMDISFEDKEEAKLFYKKFENKILEYNKNEILKKLA